MSKIKRRMFRDLQQLLRWMRGPEWETGYFASDTGGAYVLALAVGERGVTMKNLLQLREKMTMRIRIGNYSHRYWSLRV